MPTRRIKAPKTITLKAPDHYRGPDGKTLTPEPMPFAAFVARLADAPVFGQSLKGIRASIAIVEAARNATGGDIVISEDDWKTLADVARDPQSNGGYQMAPWALRQVLPYFEAILAADDPDAPVVLEEVRS